MMKMVNKRMMMMMMMAEVEGIKHAQPLALFHCMHLHTQAFAHTGICTHIPNAPLCTTHTSCLRVRLLHRLHLHPPSPPQLKVELPQRVQVRGKHAATARHGQRLQHRPCNGCPRLDLGAKEDGGQALSNMVKRGQCMRTELIQTCSTCARPLQLVLCSSA